MWDNPCSHNDRNSHELIEFINDKNLLLLNNGEATRHDINANKLSAIDLTLATTNIGTTHEWHIHGQLMQSDHFPIVTTLNTKYKHSRPEHAPRWKLSKGNWEHFKQQARHLNIHFEDTDPINRNNDTFVNALT